MHRVAVVLLVGLIVFEWRVSAGRWAGTRAAYVFPIICLVGGGLLLGHSHFIFVTKWTFLIEVSHNALGILAVLAGGEGGGGGGVAGRGGGGAGEGCAGGFGVGG